MRPRSARRLVVFVVSLGVVGWLFVWLMGKKGDIQLGSDTSGMIAAMLLTEDGSQAVSIDPKGAVTKSAGYTAGRTDRDLAWSPDGNRLFFISDRKEDSFHIFRWDPQRNAEPEQRSIDKTSRSNLFFDNKPAADSDLSGLVAVRGTVQEFFPVNGKSSQILPPSKQRVEAEEGGGAGNTFELLYNRFGKSFRVARWLKSRRFIAAVMRREEKGEALVIQDFEPDKDGRIKPPMQIFNAEKIEIDVDPATQNIVANILEVTPPEGADGKPIKAGFVHGVFIIDPTKSSNEAVAPVLLSPDIKQCVTEIKCSPDGSTLLFVPAAYAGDGNGTNAGLASCPLKPQGGGSGTQLVQGSVTSPSFSPDGTKITFVKREGQAYAVFIADSNGSNVRNLTGTTGEYSRPLFSPQYK
jgi:WD40 repeat protein